MTNIKNYIFILISIGYFCFIFFVQKEYISLPGFMQSITHFSGIEMIVSYTNAFFGSIGTLYLLNILFEKVNTVIDTGFKKLTFQHLIQNILKRFLYVSKYIIALYIGTQFIVQNDKISIFIDKIFNISFLIAILMLTHTLINGIFKELQKKEAKDQMTQHIFPILNKFTIIFIWIVGVITILSNLGYNISALITGAGVGGVAIALASQKTVANIFGALNIIFNRPFKIGDTIKIGTYIGKVTDIGLIYLKLESEEKTQILIPNETIITASIENLSYKK